MFTRNVTIIQYRSLCAIRNMEMCHEIKPLFSFLSESETIKNILQDLKQSILKEK